MSNIETILVSFFSIALLVVLISNFYTIRLLSNVLEKISLGNTKNAGVETEIAAVSNVAIDTNINTNSSGELELVDVDEETAAMIMAIVSHETHISLSNLVFKSIKAI